MNMTTPIRDDDERDKPLDPAVEEVRRKIVRFVAINLIFLMLALMAVAAAIVYKWRGSAAPAGATTGLALPVDGQTIRGVIGLPAGARVVSQSLSGDRVSLHVENAGGKRSIFIYDLAAGRMVAQFDIEDG